MAGAAPRPVWINLEYLSAEAYVERNHGLASPQLSGPASGLTKWFFYPGFTPRTGGLLREAGLMERFQQADGRRWLADLGIAPRPGEQIVSLFCYDNPALGGLLDSLAGQPTLLLATAGAASRQVANALGPSMSRGALRAVGLTYVTQVQYDELLWACDVNFVRGEDSLVRAHWAGKPFVWHIYPQHDQAHAGKLNAFLDRFLADAPASLAGPLRACWAAWNGLSAERPVLPAPGPWKAQVERWRDGLLVQPDLITQLIGFVLERR
jgi:uncharacterized repeat protein (TIGR03837 family)